MVLHVRIVLVPVGGFIALLHLLGTLVQESRLGPDFLWHTSIHQNIEFGHLHQLLS